MWCEPFSRAVLIARKLLAVRAEYTFRIAALPVFSFEVQEVRVLRYMSNVIKVAIAPGFHLFPFRTEKLSPVTPMVLQDFCGRVGSCRF